MCILQIQVSWKMPRLNVKHKSRRVMAYVTCERKTQSRRVMAYVTCECKT